MPNSPMLDITCKFIQGYFVHTKILSRSFILQEYRILINFFRGRKAIEGSVISMMIMNPPSGSFGTLAVDVRQVHEFGFFALRSMCKYIQHLASKINYPVINEAGKILFEMHDDLRLALQMYSPTHARTSG